MSSSNGECIATFTCWTIAKRISYISMTRWNLAPWIWIHTCRCPGDGDACLCCRRTFKVNFRLIAMYAQCALAKLRAYTSTYAHTHTYAQLSHIPHARHTKPTMNVTYVVCRIYRMRGELHVIAHYTISTWVWMVCAFIHYTIVMMVLVKFG